MFALIEAKVLDKPFNNFTKFVAGVRNPGLGNLQLPDSM